jgi:hypothetical protein
MNAEGQGPEGVESHGNAGATRARELRLEKLRTSGSL